MLLVVTLTALLTASVPFLALAPGVYAQTDKYTSDSDIIVSINGMEIPSYNFNGHILIPIQDLENYGFQVIQYEEQDDTYYIKQTDMPKEPPVLQKESQSKGGKKVLLTGYIYINGVIEFFTGNPGNSIYNVENEPMIRVRDFEDSGNIFVNWDEKERIASITVNRKENSIEMELGTLTVRSLKSIFICKDFEWFFEGSEKREILTLYDLDNPTGYYPLAFLLDAMNLKYSLEDSILTVERTPESKKELLLENNIGQWSKQPVYDFKFVPCFELHPSFAPNETVTVFSNKEGVLYISCTDIPKLTGISFFYKDDLSYKITFYRED